MGRGGGGGLGLPADIYDPLKVMDQAEDELGLFVDEVLDVVFALL